RTSVLISPRPPRATLFPYTTLFRSTPRSAGGGANGFRGRILGHERRSAAQRTDSSIRPGAGHISSRSRSERRLASHRLANAPIRSEEHTSELQSRVDLVCRLLLEKK